VCALQALRAGRGVWCKTPDFFELLRLPGAQGGAVLACAMLVKTEPDMTPALPADDDHGVPVSVKIRERVKAARQRFHSNDNIAEFIQPGELDKLLDEVAGKMQGVLESLVIDLDNDHNTGDTARRVAKMYIKEVFNGRYVKGPAVTEFPNAEHLNELMIVGPITVRSACSHHFCPVIGKIWIGIMPNEHTNVIGLSKYARLAEWIMGRPQIQEEAVVQLADLIQEKTQPDGLALVMEASHYCMAWRGVKDMDSKMINSVMRGVFLKDPNLRREFLSLIPR
jgi:GTP cyclohydrolase I